MVTNAVGSVTGSVATLTVLVPPLITAQPQSQTNVAGTEASFGATASGTEPMSYQWQFNALAIPGATGANLTLASAQPTNAGSYTVVVTNPVGSVTSAVAVLTVLVPPVITAPPTNLVVVAGTNASFTVTAGGTSPLSYQWRLNGAYLTSATGTSLMLTGVRPTNAGVYTVVITNMVAGLTSPAATLTVVVPPRFVSITLLPDKPPPLRSVPSPISPTG